MRPYFPDAKKCYRSLASIDDKSLKIKNLAGSLLKVVKNYSKNSAGIDLSTQLRVPAILNAHLIKEANFMQNQSARKKYDNINIITEGYKGFIKWNKKEDRQVYQNLWIFFHNEKHDYVKILCLMTMIGFIKKLARDANF